MATPTSSHIDPPAAAPRKLPVKRRTLQPPPPPPPPSSLDQNPDPLLLLPHDPAYDSKFDDEADAEGSAASESSADARSAAAVAPPFRYQRVWSESDEIRFLQGLLGCWAQGLVFPRDLNLFFDRFSESMPQPYTRPQLSEKLRRLRKKFRVMSARVSRGQDPARLAPHDRDMLHLCTRLWHPFHAATSPFSSPDALAPGSGGNKRRRPNPRIPCGPARADTPHPLTAPLPVPITTLPPLPADEKVTCATNITSVSAAHFLPLIKEEKETKAEKDAGACKDEAVIAGKDESQLLKKAALDVFDACLREFKATIPNSSSSNATKKNDLRRRWLELRVTEMDVMARRLRLLLESPIKN